MRASFGYNTTCTQHCLGCCSSLLPFVFTAILHLLVQIERPCDDRAAATGLTGNDPSTRALLPACGLTNSLPELLLQRQRHLRNYVAAAVLVRKHLIGV